MENTRAKTFASKYLIVFTVVDVHTQKPTKTIAQPRAGKNKPRMKIII
jgi:hypothetical protein